MSDKSGKMLDWRPVKESLGKRKENQEAMLLKAKAEKEEQLAKKSPQADQLNERLIMMKNADAEVNEARKSLASKEEEERKLQALKEEKDRNDKRSEDEEERKFQALKEEKERNDKRSKDQEKQEELDRRNQKDADKNGSLTVRTSSYLIVKYFGQWDENGEIDQPSLAKFDALRCRPSFGELRPCAVETMCDIMNMNTASMFIDAGSGRGKLALQVFFRYPNVKKIVAMELMKSRYDVGVAGMRNLQKNFPMTFDLEEHKDGTTVLFSFKGQNRVMEMKNMDLFDLPKETYQQADVLLLETAIMRHDEIRSKVLMQTKVGCHILSYEPYRNYGKVSIECNCGKNCNVGFHLGMMQGERFIDIGKDVTFHTTWGTNCEFAMAKRLH